MVQKINYAIPHFRLNLKKEDVFQLAQIFLNVLYKLLDCIIIKYTEMFYKLTSTTFQFLCSS